MNSLLHLVICEPFVGAGDAILVFYPVSQVPIRPKQRTGPDKAVVQGTHFGRITGDKLGICDEGMAARNSFARAGSVVGYLDG
jgi:hypothetical protein